MRVFDLEKFALALSANILVLGLKSKIYFNDIKAIIMSLKIFILNKMHLFFQGPLICLVIREMVLVEKAWALKELMALGPVLSGGSAGTA